MPKLEKSLRREAARDRARRGMKTESRSVFTIQRRLGERARPDKVDTRRSPDNARRSSQHYSPQSATR